MTRYETKQLLSGGADVVSTTGRFIRLNRCYAAAGSKMEVPNMLTIRADHGDWVKLREFDVLDFGRSVNRIEYQLFDAPNKVNAGNVIDVELVISDEPIMTGVLTKPRQMWYPLNGTVGANAGKVVEAITTIFSKNGLTARPIARRWQFQNNNSSYPFYLAENHDNAATQGLFLPQATATFGQIFDVEIGDNSIYLINPNGAQATVLASVLIEWT